MAAADRSATPVAPVFPIFRHVHSPLSTQRSASASTAAGIVSQGSEAPSTPGGVPSQARSELDIDCESDDESGSAGEGKHKSAKAAGPARASSAKTDTQKKLDNIDACVEEWSECGMYRTGDRLFCAACNAPLEHVLRSHVLQHLIGAKHEAAAVKMQEKGYKVGLLPLFSERNEERDAAPDRRTKEGKKEVARGDTGATVLRAHLAAYQKHMAGHPSSPFLYPHLRDRESARQPPRQMSLAVRETRRSLQ